MRSPFFLGLFLLSAVSKNAYAFSPSECLQQLTKMGEKKTVFTGRDNIYCSFLKRNTIQEATFDIKNSNIEDWDISIGQWNKQSLSIDSTNKPSITKKDNQYKLLTNANNINAIVWISNNNNAGEIANVKLEKTFIKRDEDECTAFKNTLIWKDISWDHLNEKYIGNDIINLNNTVYLNTLALQFKKYNDRGRNNYFTDDFSIAFKMKSDSADWMVYVGVYNEQTKDVSICHEWNLAEEYPEITISSDTTIFLNPSEESTCKNNIIWWQNIKNDQNSQRIWISGLSVKNCGNDDDEEDED
ncbi:hypothetical protein BCR36DRAFT_410182 [Piromyces finnis]|uniref:Uncharacterized protein n=1 Tax=Piromyces finnis TaxID=1754191 RepID=A0A1Y1VFR4_9FUNG|nr:hypothetical protein BCR36DRAFT_410182 [Piromyces finnis]|eukprot:ORX55238.1 hypothetical protein BCR36DRAFT_410182 [Piromyces finnis]